jgi:diguanylate cyclase (GGDEF)-like protein/PAS domain S-box-containing protein
MKPVSLRGVVTAIGASVALVTALSLPAAYFASGYSHLSQHLDFKADLNAAYLAKYINTHTAVWQFQRVRIAELISQTDGVDTDFRKRVLDSSGKVVLDEGDEPDAPTLIRRHPVVVAGTLFASVEIEASLRPLLNNTAFVALFSSLLGFGIFFALRIFPLRALDRTTGELERSHESIAQTNRRFDAALSNMAQGLCMFDAQGRIILFNERYTKMMGLAAGAIEGRSLLDLFQLRKASGDFAGNPEEFYARVIADVAAGKSSTKIMETPNGRALRVIDQPMPGAGWVATFEDITEQRAAQEKISHMALHDGLTNLPNRVMFREQLEARLRHLGRDQMFAVLCFDLDRFKTVNDTLGHPFGDKLLRQVAERMRNCIREGDTLARLGGDEFAILQARVDQAEETGALAARLIEVIRPPFDLDGQQVAVGVSIGITVAPGDGIDPDQLLKNADMALYRAKAEGKGTYRFFEPAMDLLMQARRTLELDLRRAIVNQEFEIYYQPLINLQSDEICGFEALLRWNHPERGLIPPLDFISLAEETALIVPIGEWVIRRACQEAAKWPRDVSIAINLSPAQFKMSNLSEMVMSALAHSGLAPHRLELEITESVLLVDNNSTLGTLHQLRALGVKISMDDFGTGYSSLSYLRSFPFDKIKIDRSFVHDLESSEDSKAIVRAVTGLGASLGMATTGEGVETREEADYLRREGCTEAQGYFYSKAKPASEVFKMLRERNGAASAVA